MKKVRATDFKRGDKVIYTQGSYGNGLSITEAVVTVVAKGVVHVKSVTEHGWEIKEKFGEIVGHFQENPRPLWRLRKITPGENLKNLYKRAKKATALRHRYEELYRHIQTEVEEEARKWKYEEINRRTAKLPHGSGFYDRVLARMGFRKPKQILFRD